MSGRRLPTIRFAAALAPALLAVTTLAVVLLVVPWSHGAGTGTAGRVAAAGGLVAPAGAGSAGTARRLGPYDRGTISFALALRLHERALNGYLAHVDPSTSGHGLSAAQFGARFGQSAAALRRLRALLRRRGITVTQLYAQRTAMRVRAPVTTIRRTFDVRLGRYETASGIRYFAADNRPTVPAALAPYVSAVADLSDAPEPADDVPANGLTPKITAKAYDIAPLWARGDTGAGQTIAVASDFGAINPADLAAFAAKTGQPVPDVEFRKVDGGSTYDPEAGSDVEVDLDLQVIAGVAPRARIIDYDGPSQQTGRSLADIYNQIESDGLAHIVTTSYGVCEQGEAQGSPGDQQLTDDSLKALEAHDVTVFVASGDNGAYACLGSLQQIQPAVSLPSVYTQLGVQTPASSPYVVSVGGTRIELRSNGSYLDESAWSNPLQRSGGGGGVSLDEPRPVWQQGPGVTTAGANPERHRQVPDVSGPADPNSGFFDCSTPPGGTDPTCGPGNGGTSAASPFWAASMLLVQQYAAQHGAGDLDHCFAAPILYKLAATRQPVPPFHRITLGNNGFYPAQPGWNYATGLGTPDVFNLAQDYAAFLKTDGGKSCPF